jgi:hypothetical protein
MSDGHLKVRAETKNSLSKLHDRGRLSEARRLVAPDFPSEIHPATGLHRAARRAAFFLTQRDGVEEVLATQGRR